MLEETFLFEFRPTPRAAQTEKLEMRQASRTAIELRPQQAVACRKMNVDGFLPSAPGVFPAQGSFERQRIGGVRDDFRPSFRRDGPVLGDASNRRVRRQWTDRRKFQEV